MKPIMLDRITFYAGDCYYGCLDCGFVYAGKSPHPPCHCPPKPATHRVSAVDVDSGYITIEAL